MNKFTKATEEIVEEMKDDYEFGPMSFSAKLRAAANENKEGNSYTRYMVCFSRKLKKPVVVEVTTENGKEKTLNIDIYDTNIENLLEEKEEVHYSESIKFRMEDMLMKGDSRLQLTSKPIANLKGYVMGNAANVQEISVAKDYQRNGLGTLMVNLAKDYYARSTETGLTRSAVLRFSKNNIPEDLAYLNRLERKMGSAGELLAHAKSKIFGYDSEKAYLTFLAERAGARCEDNPYQVPFCSKIKPKNMINQIDAPEDRSTSIQFGDEVIDIEELYSKPVIGGNHKISVPPFVCM